jgi:hypothetical protein
MRANKTRVDFEGAALGLTCKPFASVRNAARRHETRIDTLCRWQEPFTVRRVLQ